MALLPLLLHTETFPLSVVVPRIILCFAAAVSRKFLNYVEEGIVFSFSYLMICVCG